MTNLEPILVWALKIVVGLLLSFLTWFARISHVKLQKTISKEEAVSLIDLKVDSVRSELSTKMDQLLVTNIEATEQRRETNSKLATISTDVAIVKNDVIHMKEDVSTINRRIDNTENRVDSLNNQIRA